MPFGRTFGPQFQEFLTKDEVAKGHADWAKRYGIVSTSPWMEKQPHRLTLHRTCGSPPPSTLASTTHLAASGPWISLGTANLASFEVDI